MSTGWERATKIMATVALSAIGALSIGCGPAPGYEPEPRAPVGYAPVGDTSVETYPQPASSAELQARAEAQQADPSTQGEIAVGADNNEYADTDPSALTDFKPALDGHGAWVDDPTYGTVWVPSEAEVGTDFVPYTTAGHWTYSDDTNYVWVSDYSWGWAPFHYGRWAHIGHHGWGWIPGRTYSGGWVTWRTGGAGYDYVGWSPAGPDWYWYNGYAVGWTWGYTPYYSYCHRDYLYNPYLGRHVVYGADPRAREYEGHTRPYVASAPPAGGGRVGATPTVGAPGRVAATPSVGNGRVAATPGVGPRPSEIGISPHTVVAPPQDNAGLAHARSFAAPSTAVAQGASPPGVVRRRTDPIAAASSPRVGDGRSPVMSNRYDAAARAPQVAGVAPAPVSRPTASAYSGRAYGGSNAAASSPAYRSSPSSGFASRSPSYSAAPANRSSSMPTYRSAPSFTPSAPSHSSPSYSAPSHSVSMPSSPSHSSSPAPARSSPSRSSGRGHR